MIKYFVPFPSSVTNKTRSISKIKPSSDEKNKINVSFEILIIIFVLILRFFRMVKSEKKVRFGVDNDWL